MRATGMHADSDAAAVIAMVTVAMVTGDALTRRRTVRSLHKRNDGAPFIAADTRVKKLVATTGARHMCHEKILVAKQLETVAPVTTPFTVCRSREREKNFAPQTCREVVFLRH